ncbi:ribonuclease H-like domain-containing protein [Tanacetum coccineum]
MRWAHESRAGDEDYYARALLDYEAEHGMSFTLHHCWEVLKGSPKWMDTKGPNFATKHQASKRYKTFGSISFNTDSEDASINLNVDVGDDEEDVV